MTIQEVYVERISGLVEAATQLDREQITEPLWYRGVRCSSYTLKPKIYRDGRTSDEVFEREARLLNRFRQRSQAYWREGYPQTSWEHLFAMQHYGVPTRLLDWSENLLVAAYFASGLDGGHTHENECESIVWAIDPVIWNRSTPVLSEFGDQIHILNTVDEELEAYAPFSERKRQRSPVAIYGSHNTQRILAQRGTFMIWGSEDASLEDLAARHADVLLRKFVIRGSKGVIAEDLRRLGFTETMFFPDLISLASELTAMERWR